MKIINKRNNASPTFIKNLPVGTAFYYKESVTGHHYVVVSLPSALREHARGKTAIVALDTGVLSLSDGYSEAVVVQASVVIE